MMQQDLQRVLSNPWIDTSTKNQLLQMIQKTKGSVQMIYTVGGKMMYSPITGERVYIPEPKFGNLKIGGMDIPIVSTYDPESQQWNHQPMTPGGQQQGAAQPGQGQQGGAAPGQQGAIDWSPQGLLRLEQTQKGAVRAAEEEQGKLAQQELSP